MPLRDQIGVAENGVAHFESRLEPIGDSTLRVEWYKDGQSLEASEFSQALLLYATLSFDGYAIWSYCFQVNVIFFVFLLRFSNHYFLQFWVCGTHHQSCFNL